MSYTTPKPRAVFDIECVVDYFLIYFKDIATGRKKYFELFQSRPLDRAGLIRVLRNFTLIGYNSLDYDIPMLKAALKQGTTNAQLKQINDAIINRRLRYWQTEREFNLPKIDWLDHIDLIEPAPSVNVSLKLYGGRLGSKRIQDLPFDPDDRMFDGTEGKREETIRYCENDLDTTIDLYKHIEPQLDLRAAMSDQYKVDVRSKSDAQIAEAVIRSELERVRGYGGEKPEYPLDYSFNYDAPDFLEYQTERMREVFGIVRNATFKLKKKRVKEDDDAADDPSDGSGGVKIKVSGIEMPSEIKGLRIRMGESTYKMGIGGLHSMEKRSCHLADDDYVYVDADVGAFYPAIKLVCNLYPEHLGHDYIDIYRSIRERRMAAKKAKDKVTDMTLKIVLNGAFGKLGSKYSFLYSPKLMLQVTLTGQLVLLMLIEQLEDGGFSVVSANTDGIVTRVHRTRVDDYKLIIRDWEKRTGFEMEFAIYSALYSASVNSYLAIKPKFDDEPDLHRELFPHMDDDALRKEFKGGVKQKGLYAFVGSKGSPAEKNPKNYVCIDAVIAYLTKATPIEETIEWCPDVRRFLSVQRVRGGAEFEGQFLGKVARWYRSRKSRSCIRYATGDKKGDKVSMSDNARPMMELTGLPSDLDYDWYIGVSRKMLGELGVL